MQVYKQPIIVLIGLHILKICFSQVFDITLFYSFVVTIYLYLGYYSFCKICLKLLRHQLRFSFNLAFDLRDCTKSTLLLTPSNVTGSNTFIPYSNINIIPGLSMFISIYIFKVKVILKLFRHYSRLPQIILVRIDETCDLKLSHFPSMRVSYEFHNA